MTAPDTSDLAVTRWRQYMRDAGNEPCEAFVAALAAERDEARETAEGLEKHADAETARADVAEDGRTQAAIDVLAERQRQMAAEGWTFEHDDKHTGGEVAYAAACYVLSTRWRARNNGIGKIIERLWPWETAWWKPKSRRHDLVRAGALILAEIERLDRVAAREAKP